VQRSLGLRHGSALVAPGTDASLASYDSDLIIDFLLKMLRVADNVADHGS